MIWLVVIGLCIWIFFQQQRLKALGARIAQLSEEVRALALAAHPRPPTPAPGVADIADDPPATSVIATAAPAAEPRPQASEGAPGRSPVPAVFPGFAPSRPSRSIADWLSENGLAWLGGAVLVLGGLLLVAYAAQRGIFTPALRIASAALLGAIALGLGEWLRGRPIGERADDRLVAALLTAAGAAILYSAIWAAHGLYGFIPAAIAGGLLALVSFGLLALSLRHGEPLGLLAVGGAYAAPLVTGMGVWSAAGLDAYVTLILATGLGAAALSGWFGAGMLALAGSALWSGARLATGDVVGAGVLAGAITALTLAAAFVNGRRRGPAAEASDRVGKLPAVAAAIASALAILLWFRPSPGPEAAALVVMLACIVSASALKLGRASARMLIAPAAAAVLAAAGSSLIVATQHPVSILWICLMLVGLAAAGLDGARRPAGGALAAAIGAGGAALALTLADAGMAATVLSWRILVEAGFAVLLGGGTVLLARRSPAASQDLGVAAWVGAAAETAGLVLHALVPGEVAPLGYAGLGVCLALLAVRLGWRGLAEAAAVAALASFAALLGPDLAGSVLGGGGDWRIVGAVAFGAALIQGGIWRGLKARGDAPAAADAASTLAVLSALLGGFLVLRAWATPDGGTAGLAPFVEASLRTLLLLATGLTLAGRGAGTPLGRWRAPVLLALGALHGLYLQGLILHPWWGRPAVLGGWPLADELLLGLLAPGVILGLAARRLVAVLRPFAVTATAAVLGFVALWVVSELRRLFHGPKLAGGGLGYAEVGAYGAAALAFVIGLRATRLHRAGLLGGPIAAVRALDLLAWAAVVAAGVLLCWAASPWWGLLAGDFHSPGLLALDYAVAVGLGVMLMHEAKRSGARRLAEGALVAAGLEAFAALTLVVRYAFQGGAMRAPLREAGFETWTFSAAWALYGVAALAGGAKIRDPALRWLGLAVLLFTTLKVFLFDLAHLGGVVRAASFLALGAILLVGALAARRFSAGRPSPSAGEGAGPPSPLLEP